MHIQSLSLKTHALDALKHFYGEKWGLPISHETPDSFMLMVGASYLTFERDTSQEWRYHFAFNIAPNHLDMAQTWLTTHADCLPYEGNLRVHQSASWNADALYYRDPAGNIGELIARYRLPVVAHTGFDAHQILNLSEIGIPTRDVLATVQALNTHGLPAFQAGSDTFYGLGDDNGLLIVVKWGRLWFPTPDVPADCLPIQVTLQVDEALLQLDSQTIHLLTDAPSLQ